MSYGFVYKNILQGKLYNSDIGDDLDFRPLALEPFSLHFINNLLLYKGLIMR
jgi:hypothetical protein